MMPHAADLQEHVATPDAYRSFAKPDSSLEYLNAAGREYLGRPLDDLVGRGWMDVVHPDDQSHLTDAWAACRFGEMPFHVELRLRRHDGVYRWHISRGLSERDAAGAVARVVGICTDIDDQRRAEAALRASEARFRAIIERSLDAVILFGPDGRVRYATPSSARLMGYEPTDLDGRDGFELVHPDDAPRTREALAGLVTQPGATAVMVYRVRHRDGGWRWLEARATNLLHEPAVGAVAVTYRDVTGERDAADALRASEEQYRQLFEANPLPMWVYEPVTLGFVAVNDAAVARYGYSRAEFLAMTITDIRPPEDAPAAREAARQANGQNLGRVWRHLWKDGTVRQVEVASHDIQYGGRAARLVLALDVTDRLRAEQARAKLAAIVDSSDDAILGLTPDGVVETWNAGAERLYGYTAAEVVGRSVALLIPPDQADYLMDLTARLARGEHVPPYETVRKRQDGTQVDVSVRLSPQRDSAGRLAGYSAIVRDITARKRLEEQYRQAQKMEAVGRLAGGVAHDFNNLLTVINGYSEVALDALPAVDPVRPLVAEVLKAGGRAAELTRQLLAYGRKQMLRPQVLDLGALVAGLGGMLRRVIGEDIELVLDPDPARVTADPGQLEQVVMNLAVNARDAMPTGGRLTIGTRVVTRGPGQVALGREGRPGRYAELRVADTGTGIRPEALPHLFEPFFTTKGVGEGTGLGLATVHGIIQQSAGHVDVETEVGRGTTFRVYLPEAGAGPSASAERPAPPLPARGAETVLLVEDDDEVRALSLRALQNAGYVVADAAGGEQALGIVAAHRVAADLLVTDVVMPGMGGRELADRLKAACPGLKVLFVSGYTDDAVVRHGVEWDEVHFLQKPFTPTDLVLKVREVLDESSLLRS
jgi:PAS domain S-box-containing protein